MLVCNTCRTKHLKCDREQPRCGRCQATDSVCVRDGRSLRTKRDKSKFAASQVWVTVPPKVDFVFENPDGTTESIETQVEEDDGGDLSLEDPIPDVTYSPDVAHHLPPSSHHHHAFLSPILTQASPVDSISSTRNRGATITTTTNLSLSCSPISARVHSPTDSRYSVPQPTQRWSLVQTEQEAMLIGHFVDGVSPFFDVADIDRHFGIVVPQRARHNEILLHAVLALSARHLSLTSSFDPYVSDRYMQSCLQALIPAIGNGDVAADDAVFAAACILRMLEELDAPLVGSDPHRHRLGTQAIIAASHSEPSLPYTGLRKACYRQAYRQEICVSLMSQVALQWELPENLCVREAHDDYTWYLSTLHHHADVLDYAFKATTEPKSQRYAQLLQDIDQWHHRRPRTFDPIFYLDASLAAGRVFPRIFLAGETQVIAYAYIYCAHSILVAHAPIPRIGPGRMRENMQNDQTIRTDVLNMCGIALCHPKVPTAALIACMAITLFGDRFTDAREIAELRTVLIETERVHGWPTTNVRRDLGDGWT